MSYEEAIQKAGAEIHAFQNFGSYQGDWWAKVTFGAETGWINGSYGSCSGCDAFESEFGYGSDKCDEHKYESDEKAEGCEVCAEKKANYESRLIDFGKGYLGDIMTKEEALAKASENLEWDMDAKEMVDFIAAN